MKRLWPILLGKKRSCLAEVAMLLLPLLLTGFPAYGARVEDDPNRRPPKVSKDPFFQPVKPQTFQEIPQALSKEGAPVEAEFFAPESLDTLESLPRTLGPDGEPLGDYKGKPAIPEKEPAPPSPPKPSWLRRGGFLEYKGTYSTNIDLSAPGADTDLQRNHLTAAQSLNETEVSDWINGFNFGYEYEMAVVPEAMKLALRYSFQGEQFESHGREDRSRHVFELASIQRLSDQIEWEIYGGFDIENRDSKAQYLRPDYEQFYFGTEVRGMIGEGKRLSIGYEHAKRDYDDLIGAVPPVPTAWKDWDENRLWLRYDHKICDSVELNLRFDYAHRDHESQAETAIGDAIPGSFRQYDQWEPRAGLTFYPSEQDKVTVFYKFRDLVSTGDFYDYKQHSVTVRYAHQICPQVFPGLVFRSEFEYAKRDYDHQVAFADLAGGARVSRNQVREDERATLYLALERTVCKVWTAGLDFTYIDNDSNDDSSRYQEDRYGVYVRREF